MTSLWQVPDRQTSEIMVSFYEYLKKGFAKNTALQKVKLDYLNNTEDEFLQHPYYWAGFVISGNVASIQSSNPFWWWIFGGFFLGLGIWWIKKNYSI